MATNGVVQEEENVENTKGNHGNHSVSFPCSGDGEWGLGMRKVSFSDLHVPIEPRPHLSPRRGCGWAGLVFSLVFVTVCCVLDSSLCSWLAILQRSAIRLDYA